MLRNKKLLFISALFILMVFFLVFMNRGSSTVGLRIDTSPISTVISINGKSYGEKSTGSEFNVPRGEVSIEVSRDGFNTVSGIYDIGYENEKPVLYIKLQPSSSDAIELLKSEAESINNQGVVTAKYLDLVDSSFKENPILELLPYYGRYFTASQGVSKKHPNSADKFAIYVILYDKFKKRGIEEFNDFIIESGYSIDSFEVIYNIEKY